MSITSSLESKDCGSMTMLDDTDEVFLSGIMGTTVVEIASFTSGDNARRSSRLFRTRISDLISNFREYRAMQSDKP
jgi:hypothetical protein